MRANPRPSLTLIACLLALGSAGARADSAAAAEDPAPLERGASSLEARYFGTLGYAIGGTDALRPRANTRQDFGAGPAGSFRTDSKAGAQLDWRPTPTLSATAMAYCESALEGCPKLLWAYAKWDFAPDYALRAGRFRMSPFLGSEAQEVGYLTTWARSPTELYNIYPSDDLTGGQIERAWGAFGGEVRGSILAGVQHGVSADVGSYKLKVAGAKLRGSSPGIEWTLAANHYALDYQNPIGAQGLLDAATQAGYGAVALDYNHPVSGWLYSAGGRWTSDTGAYFAQAEVGLRRSDKLVVNNIVSGYAMLGARRGRATYFATRGFAHNLTDPNESRGGPFNASFQNALSNNVWSHSSWNVGARWEFDRHWAAKAQLGWHKSNGGGADNTLYAPQGPNTPGGSYREGLLTLDFLF